MHSIATPTRSPLTIRHSCRIRFGGAREWDMLAMLGIQNIEQQRNSANPHFMSVSVIIPTYNRSSLLRAAIDSVLGQSYQNFDIIVVDDESSDDTAQWVSGYSAKITYIRQQNAGVNAARNRALEVAKGEYIALLDDDDLWFDFKLDLQVAVLNHYRDAGFVFSDFLIRKDSGQEIRSGLRTWHAQARNWDQIFVTRDSGSSLGLSRLVPTLDRDFHVYRGDIYAPSLFEPYVASIRISGSSRMTRRAATGISFRDCHIDTPRRSWIWKRRSIAATTMRCD
jgi:glycosyltransferase involved in cell wall biosynthesis